jgi:hypothetical protein
LHAVSGLVRDDVAMEFCFAPATFTTAVGVAIAGDIEHFFNDLWTGATARIGSYLSRRISRTVAPTVDVWDLTGHLDGSPLGSPDVSQPFAFNLPAADTGHPDLPPEVAAKVSIHGDLTGLVEIGPDATLPTTHRAQEMGAPATYVSFTKPKARRRGGFYFGPLGTAEDILTQDATSQEVYLATPFITDLAIAYKEGLMDGIHVPVVWSRREANVFPVVGVKVDNAVDIQRRRGNRNTTFVTRP